SCGRHECIECSVFGLRRSTGRVHGLNVNAGVLLHKIDARTRSLDLAPDGGWHCDPMARRFGKVLDGRMDGAVLPDQRSHDVIDRLQEPALSAGCHDGKARISWPD